MPLLHQRIIKAGGQVDLTEDGQYLILSKSDLWQKIADLNAECVVTIRVESSCPEKPETTDTLYSRVNIDPGCRGSDG